MRFQRKTGHISDTIIDDDRLCSTVPRSFFLFLSVFYCFSVFFFFSIVFVLCIIAAPGV